MTRATVHEVPITRSGCRPASEFALTVDIGNAAMQNPADVADILRDVAALLYGGQTSGPIRDANGNTVGKFTCDHWPDA